MTKTFVEEFVENPQRMRLYQQERAIYEVTEQLESLMTHLGVSRAELARLLGKSRGWVTQLLDGEANKTIRTVADTFAVLGQEYHSSYHQIKVGAYGGTSSREVLATSSVTTWPNNQQVRIYDPSAKVGAHISTANDSSQPAQAFN
jgi:hypothetical protein